MPLNSSRRAASGSGTGREEERDLPSTGARGWRATEVRRLPAARRGEGGKQVANQDDRARLPQLRMQI